MQGTNFHLTVRNMALHLRQLLLKWSPVSFGSFNFLVPKKFGHREIWLQKNLVTEKFGTRDNPDIWDLRNLSLKKIWP